MKRIILSLFLLALSLTGARADEGMWLLRLMEQQHLADSLRKAGLELSTDELYSETAPSLREVVGIFGGGCTGEIVSADGLVLTNHHCGFSFVHEMSAIGHDYMKDGYFAHSRAEELRTPETLTFTFTLAVEDVTDRVKAEAERQGVDVYTAMSQSFLEPFAQELLAKSAYKKKKGVTARIVPYFAANRFYIFYEQEFLDVRLVANPPYNVGQFGGNSDNWMWPRQNADFALFRIYADRNGNPAPYSEKNVPLKVKKFLPISLRGYEEGDYAMIMGYPGRTSRFLTASQVKFRCENNNRPIIVAGNPLLAYYKGLMDQSDELRLLLEDEYFSWGNSIKNFGGMNQAVERIHLIDQKKAEEARFRAFAAESGNEEYLDVIDRIDSVCAKYADVIHDLTLYRIALADQSFSVDLDNLDNFIEAVRGGKAGEIQAAGDTLMQSQLAVLHSVNLEVDKNKTLLLTPYYLKEHRFDGVPYYLNDSLDWRGFVESVYDESLFADSARLAQVIAARDTAALQGDPLYLQNIMLMSFLMNSGLYNEANIYQAEISYLNHVYVRGLCEMYGWTKAPDANFTQRMTYGHVRDLRPRDAVRYDWRTVLDGMFEKESATESDYFINERLRQLYEAGDFGRYARADGKLPACFLTDNDITGGNSGSPVMNARGELIGLAFDGNIESLSSDLKFNPELQRCINVDIRYVLFIIDKFGGSTYVLDEMEIRE